MKIGGYLANIVAKFRNHLIQAKFFYPLSVDGKHHPSRIFSAIEALAIIEAPGLNGWLGLAEVPSLRADGRVVPLIVLLDLAFLASGSGIISFFFPFQSSTLPFLMGEVLGASSLGRFS